MQQKGSNHSTVHKGIEYTSVLLDPILTNLTNNLLEKG